MTRLALGLLILAAGCSDVLSPGNALTELDAARQKWSHAGLHDYAFTVRQVCFCINTARTRVVVLSDTVNSAFVIQDNQPVDRRFVPTIGGLFDFIEHGIRNHAQTLQVTYDRDRGFPTHINYDGSFSVADDEVTYDVSDVGPLVFTLDRITAQRPPLPRAADPRRP